MMKIKILLIVLLASITTGCLNYTELNEIGIIDMLGINKKDDKYIISINMLTPTEKDLEKSNHFEATASSIPEAFDKLYLLTEKDINLSHLELLLLNKNLTKKDYDNIFNFFLNRNDSRNTFNVVIVEDYNEKNIFNFDSDEINSLIKTNENQDGLVTAKSLDKITEDIFNLKVSYIPSIKINTSIKILGYRSIYKENKLLSQNESISYNFLTNNIIKCNLVDENLNIKIDKTITTTRIKKNKIIINITSTLTNYSINKHIEDLYEKTLKKYLEEYINNNDLEYFWNLIKKYDYKYYKTKKNEKIIFLINIKSKLNKEAITSGY